MAEDQSPIVVWFREDLRLSDNPALWNAVNSDRPLLCVFILDEQSAGIRPFGGAARWWLHGSLEALGNALADRGGQLHIFRGSANELILRIATASKASAVFWNRRYGAAERKIDETAKQTLREQGIAAESFNGHLIHEPWTVKNSSQRPYRVFSAFWRAVQSLGSPAQPHPRPEYLRPSALPAELSRSLVSLDDLNLEPHQPDWASGLRLTWQRGESGAQHCLEEFLDDRLTSYATARDRPDQAGTSRLSPYLRFGNISIREVWYAAVAKGAASLEFGTERNLEKMLSELGWREFSYHLLYHHPELATRNFDSRFDEIAWRSDPSAIAEWQKGRTGYPLVDAGMRELWTTGWMHNRVRMIVASFLTKHLFVDWREGERWFWETLVDADPANNPASWQWVAGSGADAAPYFRIFNPVLQGEKFDPDGNYVKRWVPELSKLPSAFVHKPWKASPVQLQAAEVVLGETYPHRIVDHEFARDRALEGFRGLKSSPAKAK